MFGVEDAIFLFMNLLYARKAVLHLSSSPRKHGRGQSEDLEREEQNGE